MHRKTSSYLQVLRTARRFANAECCDTVCVRHLLYAVARHAPSSFEMLLGRFCPPPTVCLDVKTSAAPDPLLDRPLPYSDAAYRLLSRHGGTMGAVLRELGEYAERPITVWHLAAAMLWDPPPDLVDALDISGLSPGQFRYRNTIAFNLWKLMRENSLPGKDDIGGFDA